MAIGLIGAVLLVVGIYKLGCCLAVHLERAQDLVVDLAQEKFSNIRGITVAAGKMYTANNS